MVPKTVILEEHEGTLDFSSMSKNSQEGEILTETGNATEKDNR